MGPMHSAHPFALSDYPKPTIVFVPNAWFPTTAYAYFLSVLRERGYTVETINHTSLAPLQTGPSATALGTPPTASTETDAFSLRQQLLQPLVEQQYRDVILLMHGYGTKVGMSAVRGLSKVQRLRENLPGGICGMIAVSPVVCQANTILYERKNPLLRCAQRDVPRTGYCVPDNPLDNFANDCDLATAQPHLDQIRPTATGVLESVQPPSALAEDDFAINLAAVLLTNDRAIPFSTQEGLLEISGRVWLTHNMECGHSAPFIDRRAELADIVEGLIDEFERRLVNLFGTS